MENVQKSYRTDYNAMLTKIDDKFKELDTKFNNNTITQDQYNEDKYKLTQYYSTVLENKHMEDMIYDNIESDVDKYTYAISSALFSGDLKYHNGVSNTINALYVSEFNKGFKPVENRTFEMGEKYYNRVIQAAASNKIDFSSLGIECKRDEGQFIVPKDPKAILQFAECYSIAAGQEGDSIGSTLLGKIEALFTDTADNYFAGEERYTDHTFLTWLGYHYHDARNNVTKIEKDNGIRPYFMPIMSPGASDITRMQQYVFGDKTSEINLIDDNLFDRLRIADLYNYKIYANDADVIAENGGNAELYETNNPKTINELSNLIKSAKKEDITFSFATCGYEYGTMVNVKKNDGSVKCFISELFPSTQAEEYVRSPMFQAKAFLDVVKARNGGATVAHANNLGAYYSGYFHGSNNRLYYKIDGYHEDNQYPYISDPNALALRTFSLMFEQMCLNKQHLDNVTNVELPNNNDVLRFITQTDENGNPTGDISLVSILNVVTGDSEELIIERLMDHYNTYYK